MKKRISAIILICFALQVSCSAFAAGKLRVEQENFYNIETWSNYGYAFAKVSNVGNKPIKINAGILEVFDSEDENITSTDYMYSYASYLQPNEYTYVDMHEEIPAEKKEDVSDYLLTITGKSDSDYISKRLPVSDLHYEPNVQKGYYTYNYMYATVTNNTEDTIFGLTVLLVLLDEDDNILYMDDVDLSNSTGIMPGNQMQFKLDVNSYFIDYFSKHNIDPTHVDAIAYVNISQ